MKCLSIINIHMIGSDSFCSSDHMKGLADDSFYDRLSNQKCFLYCHPTTLILLEAFSQYKRILVSCNAIIFRYKYSTPITLMHNKDRQ